MEQGGNPITGGGQPLQPLQPTEGIASPQELKSAKGNRSITQKIVDWVKNSRIFYALSNIKYSMKQIQVGTVLGKTRNNQTFQNGKVEHVKGKKEGWESNSIYQQSDASDLYGINEQIPQLKEKKEGYSTFCLATTHKVMGVKSERHNVTVLYDANKGQLYVIDGKANDTEKLKLQKSEKKEGTKSVQEFVDYLSKELGVPKDNVARCKTALQRTNDCVIFPEKVMADLINDKNTGSAQDRLDNVLEKAKTDTDKFYGEINAIRDKCFNN